MLSRQELAVQIPPRALTVGSVVLLEVFVTRFKTKQAKERKDWSSWRTNLLLHTINVLAMNTNAPTESGSSFELAPVGL